MLRLIKDSHELTNKYYNKKFQKLFLQNTDRTEKLSKHICDALKLWKKEASLTFPNLQFKTALSASS